MDIETHLEGLQVFCEEKYWAVGDKVVVGVKGLGQMTFLGDRSNFFNFGRTVLYAYDQNNHEHQSIAM
jgi:hypothetical protein